MNGLITKAFAQVTGNTLNGAITQSTSGTLTIPGIVTTVITYIIYIAGVAAFIYLVYSGILYITAAGNPDQAKKGQQGIINAVIGIVIIVLAYVILKAVNTAAGNAGTTNGINSVSYLMTVVRSIV